MTMGQSRGILCGEKVFCALEVEVEGEDQCAREKILEPNQNDASDHFLSAKCLHTRPTFGSNDRFLLLNSMGFSQAKPNNKISGYLIVIQDFSSSWC